MVTDFEALDHFFVQLKTDEDALLVLADELYEHYDGGVKGAKVDRRLIGFYCMCLLTTSVQCCVQVRCLREQSAGLFFFLLGKIGVVHL